MVIVPYRNKMTRTPPDLTTTATGPVPSPFAGHDRPGYTTMRSHGTDRYPLAATTQSGWLARNNTWLRRSFS